MPASHGNGVGARSGCGGRRLYHGEVRAAALLAAAPLDIADESVPLVTAVKLARVRADPAYAAHENHLHFDLSGFHFCR